MPGTELEKHRGGPLFHRMRRPTFNPMDNKKSTVKDALKRDWEQTKHDFSKSKGRELHQDVGDTVKQAAGKEPIPPLDSPNYDKKE